MFKITKKIQSHIVQETKYASVNITVDDIEYQAVCFSLDGNINIEKIITWEESSDIEYGDLFLFIEFCVKNYLKRKLQ